MDRLTPGPGISAAQPAALGRVQVLDVELSEPLQSILARDASGVYRSAQVLVRLHGQPLGQINLDLSPGDLKPVDYSRQIWLAFAGPIRAHLRQDNLPDVQELSGLQLERKGALCQQRRQQLLRPVVAASVVICTRDRTEWLARCLPTLLELEYPDYEVIVVDNAPETDATAELVRGRFGHLPRLRYLREDRPGLSIARNTGLDAVQGEIVAYTDDDVLADRNWLAALVAALASRPDVACATGFTAPAALESEAQVWYERFGGFNKGRGFEQLCFNMDDQRPPDPLFPYLAAKFGAGVNMAFRTGVLRALGGFDDALGAGMPSGGGEDIEVFFRLIMNGYTLIYEPAAVLRHYHRADYAGLRKQLHSQGIAFTAFLTRSLLDDPRRLVYLLRRLPQAARYFWGTDSPRNSGKGPDYPAELTRTESLGMLYGPVAYLRSRRRVRRLRRTQTQGENRLP